VEHNLSYRILLLIALRKNWSKILAIVLISPVCFCVTTVGYIFAYRQIGCISDFRPIADGFQIPGSDYVLHVTRLPSKTSNSISEDSFEYSLENKIEQNLLILGQWSDYQMDYCHPTFTFFDHRGITYLITKRCSNGNSGSSVYNILNISEEKPLPVNSYNQLNDPIPDVSPCLFPRLVGDELIFEDAFDCDAYPFLEDEPFFYSVKLIQP
jgi:hypothetical protein